MNKVINNNPKLVELEFYNQVIDRLITEVPGFGASYDVVVVSDPSDTPFKPLPATERPKVVFSFSDENNRLPDYANDEDVILVFKCYAPYSPHPKLCPIPLPFKAGFTPSPRLFAARNTSVFFSGQKNGKTRENLAKQLETFGPIDSHINFTESFGAGYSMAKYAEILGDSRFAICPPGNNNETFRHTEASMSGCIIVSGPQVAYWYNHEVPFIYINNWEELPAIYDFLSKEPSVCAKLSEDTLNYYNKYLSVEAVSKVCIRTLKHELSKRFNYYSPQVTLNSNLL